MRVEIPEYNTFVDFDDNTDPKVIERTLRQNFPSKQPQKEGLWQGFVKPTAKAAARVIPTAAAGIATMPISGLAGLAAGTKTVIENAVRGTNKDAWLEANRAMEGIQQKASLIQTPEEQKSLEYLMLPMKPFEWAREGGQWLGRKAGIPYAEPVLGTLAEAGAMVALPKAGAKIKGRIDKVADRMKENLDVLGPEEKIQAEPAPLPEAVREALRKDTRKQTEQAHAGDVVELPQGKLDRPAEITLPEAETFTGIEAMKYGILSKVDPALWNATDRIFMNRMGKAREASMQTPEQKGLVLPERYTGARPEPPPPVPDPPKIDSRKLLLARKQLPYYPARKPTEADLAILSEARNQGLLDPKESAVLDQITGKAVDPVIQTGNVPSPPEIVQPGTNTSAKPVTPVIPEAPTGARNLLGRIRELGGINASEQYNVRLLRQDPDARRILSRTGKTPDEIAAILNDEGYNIGTGDNLMEIIKSGKGKDIFSPEKADAIINRKLNKEQNAWADEQVATMADAGDFTLFANPIVPAFKFAAGKVKSYLDGLDIKTMGKTPEETFGHAVRRVGQDKLIALRDWEQSLQEKYGITIPKKESAYFTEERSHGILGDKINAFDRDVVKPFIDAMARTQKQHGLTLDDLWAYMEAKGAPKRNQVIQNRLMLEKVRAADQGDIAALNHLDSVGSGLTDAEAAAVLQKYVGKQAELDSLSEIVYAINRKRLDLIERYGLETPEIVDAMRTTWGDEFISFKGKSDLRKPQTGTGSGKGIGLKNSGIKQAMGRTSRAENGVIYAFEDFKDTLARIEKNEVAKKFLDLVENIKDPSIEINKPQLDRRLDPMTGQVETYNKPVWSTGEPLDPFAENVVPVIRDGQHIFIRINDNPLLARALTASYDKPSILDGVVSAVGAVTRNVAAIYTKYSPSFAVTNPIRDFFDAMQGLSTEYKVSMAKQAAKFLPESMKDIYNYNKNGVSSVYAQEFAQNGGMVGFYSGKDFKTAERYFQKEIRRGTRPGAIGASYRTLKKVGETLGNITSATENGTRLAVYKTLRENGYSVEDAASYAKNVTVNFNRKGEWKWINQLYMFSNPAIQGIQRFGKLASTRKGQAIMGTLTGLALTLNEYNRYVSGEDDGGTNNFDKISDTEKSRYILIMDPSGSGQPIIKIPLGFMQRLPFAFANGIADVMHGTKEPGKVGMDIVDATLDAFNPIGGSQVSTSLVPSIAKPGIELYANRNWLGKPIYPEQMPWDLRPDSQMAFQSVSIPSKYIAEKLNAATGGDEITPGTIDISPEAIDHVANFLTGTAGKDLYRILDLAVRYFDEMRPLSDVKAQDIPIISRFAGSNTEYYNSNKFREVSQEAQRAYQKAELWAEQGHPHIEKYVNDNLDLILLGREVGKIQRQVSMLNSDIRKARELKQFPAEVRLDVIEQLKAEREALMMQFIRAHREVKKRKEMLQAIIPAS